MRQQSPDSTRQRSKRQPASADPRPLSGDQPWRADKTLALLQRGEIEVRGLLPGSSNYTFLADVSNGQDQALVVYKPRQGEAPLWDFPHGTLCQRELAAYMVSEALGWGLVPPTTLRQGPYGKGAVQLFIAADFEQHYFTFRDEPLFLVPLQRIAAFDLVVNNADRKGGHTLVDRQGRIWAIDHGLCFHAQPKLRTVIWEFAGQPLPEALGRDLSDLSRQLEPGCPLYTTLRDLLTDGELRSIKRRIDRLVTANAFPGPDSHRRSYPWPLV